MKMILGLLLTILGGQSLATTSLTTTVVDYLRDTPAVVAGHFSMDKDLDVYKTKKSFVDIGLRVNKDENLSFSFSDKHISIDTENGLDLTVQGIPLKITSINYYELSGKFEVKTELPLNIGEKALNTEMEKVLNEHYRPKILKAFEELKRLRSQKNLKDANQVLNTVLSIFSTGTPKSLPTVKGSMSLSFFPTEDKTLKLNEWYADVLKSDRIMLEMEYVKSPEALKVSSTKIYSTKGVRLYGQTRFKEIVSVNFNSLQTSPHGILFNYQLGAEEVMGAFNILLQLINSGGDPTALRNCDLPKIEEIRAKIDGKLKQEIAFMIRKHRSELLAAGAHPQMLEALD